MPDKKKREDWESVNHYVTGERDAYAGNPPRSKDEDYRKGYNDEKTRKQ